MKKMLPLGLTLALAWPLPASGQDGFGGSDPVVAAAVALAEQFEPGLRIVVEPRIAGHRPAPVTTFEGRWDKAILDQIATALGASVGTEETVTTCSGPPSPRSCRLTGADRVVVFTKPHSAEGGAFVLIKVLESTDRDRQPIGKALYRADLSSTGDGWTVTSIVTVGRT